MVNFKLGEDDSSLSYTRHMGRGKDVRGGGELSALQFPGHIILPTSSARLFLVHAMDRIEERLVRL